MKEKRLKKKILYRPSLYVRPDENHNRTHKRAQPTTSQSSYSLTAIALAAGKEQNMDAKNTQKKERTQITTYKRTTHINRNKGKK